MLDPASRIKLFGFQMGITLLLLALSLFVSMVASKRRHTIKGRNLYEREVYALKAELHALTHRPSLTPSEQEQAAYLRNRLAFAKKHPANKIVG